MAAIARVVLLSPLPQLDRVFEYLIPDSMRAGIGPGMRVRAPLRTGGRLVEGFVLELADEAEYDGKLAALAELISTAPVLAPEIAQLARRVADRQAGVMADALRLAIPQRSVRVEQRWIEARAAGEGPAADPIEGPATPTLDGAYGASWREELGAGGVRAALRTPPGVDADGIPRSLRALAELAATRVAAGEDAILAVPDFRDVELAISALAPLLPADRIRRFDARLKPAPRYAEFLRTLEGTPGVAVGTRSALYAPAASLGAILMWDDGDDSYAEPVAPYAHARDVALLRQAESGCGLVLASRTPSSACERLVELGFLAPVEPRRRPHPRVLLSDAILDGDERMRSARIPSLAWRTASEALERGPVLIQVGRAGYIASLACSACRTPASCRECHAPLALAARTAEPSCRVCGAVQRGWRCPECGGAQLRPLGLGAGRTAEELGRAFPGTRVLVADAEAQLVRIEGAKTIVVATRGAEPVPPGGYAAVLLLDGERMLLREGLDVAVETLRGWSNAAALAADGAQTVLAGGEHPAAIALRDGREPAFVAEDLAARRALRFPPAVRVAQVTGTHSEVEPALARLREEVPGLDVLGPVPADDGGVIATLRVGYGEAAALAARAKAELVRAATSASAGRGRGAGGRPGRGSTLRIRFDPPHPF